MKYRYLDTLTAIASSNRLPTLPAVEEYARTQAIAQYWRSPLGRLHWSIAFPFFWVRSRNWSLMLYRFKRGV